MTFLFDQFVLAETTPDPVALVVAVARLLGWFGGQNVI